MRRYLHIHDSAPAAIAGHGQVAHAAPAPSAAFVASAFALAAAWLSLVLALASAGVFQAPPQSPPVAILLAIGLPPAVFVLFVRSLPALRRQVLSIDPVWLAAVQGLRAVGAGFLFLYAFGVLPALFAHPAGWGDLIVALLAPFVAVRLARDPSFLASAWHWRFHALGVLDFAGALGSGLLARGTFPALVEGATTSPLGDLPLVLIPAFAVPLWICLHVSAFVHIRAAREPKPAPAH